jgi:predicted nucleic acid-binding protein
VMRLVDTSAWIEWLTGSPLSPVLAAELPSASEWLVPAIVPLELAKWMAREAGEDEADRVIAFTETCTVAKLDTAIALSAAACRSGGDLSSVEDQCAVLFRRFARPLRKREGEEDAPTSLPLPRRVSSPFPEGVC